MRTRMYGGVRGRKTKVGGKPTFVFLLLDCVIPVLLEYCVQDICQAVTAVEKLFLEKRCEVIDVLV